MSTRYFIRTTIDDKPVALYRLTVNQTAKTVGEELWLNRKAWTPTDRLVKFLIDLDPNYFEVEEAEAKAEFPEAFDPSLVKSATQPVIKHPGHPDQKVHGKKGPGSVPDVVDLPGVGKITKGKDSLHEHLVPDGAGGYTLSPERRAVHEAIIASHLEGVPKSDDPTLTMMGGGGGAGKGVIQKSEAGRAAIEAAGVRLPNTDAREAVKIDPDEIKSELPEFREMVDSGRKAETAGFLHEESSIISKEIQKRAIENGQDVLLDGTGNSTEAKLQGKIDQAREAGYKVNGIYASVPTEQAMARNILRAQNNADRGLVPPWAMAEAHESVSRIVPSMADKFDTFVLFDTSTRSPSVLAQTTRGKPLQVVDRGGFDSFLAKATSPVSVDALSGMVGLSDAELNRLADGR